MRFVLLFACALLVAPLRAEEPTKPPLPSHEVWVMRYDSKLDGENTGKLADAVHWSLTVRNDRISGGLDGMKAGDPKDHRMSGEFVTGKPSIVLLRQDGPGGLVCYYTGSLENGRLSGTWFDNRGGRGDFEVLLDKK